MITVGLIEDDPKLRLNFETFFKLDKEVDVVFSYSSIEQFLANKNSITYEPFIVFLDIGLPGISGLEGVSIINKQYKETHLVILSGNNDEEVIWQAISKGANGYLLKPVSLQEIKKQIEIVKNGGALISPEIAQIIIGRVNNLGQKKQQPVSDKLTARENDVIEQLVNGFTYKEIANVLGISATTVNDHLKNIYNKLGVNSKAELISKILSARA
ncbi:MAG: response regulator transcription factor [Bacteroidetes bacterium]|nr:response regulator transcription factor [Bacteroidota bacterium]MBS1648628.1 response regulator transcription factor [Bacteroidota bacterium]